MSQTKLNRNKKQKKPVRVQGAMRKRNLQSVVGAAGRKRLFPIVQRGDVRVSAFSPSFQPVANEKKLFLKQ